MATLININGQIMPPDQAFISVFDHGLLFGDSVYEVFTTCKGKLFAENEHLTRLKASAKAISLKIPFTDEYLLEEMQKTFDAAENSESYARMVITRGKGEIHISPLSCNSPTMILYVKEAEKYPEEYYSKGIAIAVVSTKRNLKDSLNPGIKTGNYLNSVLAIIEAEKLGAYDGLMLNSDGFVSECTTSNFYLVKNGGVKTADPGCGILVGITRKMLIEVARENGIAVQECKISPEEIPAVDELFITSTTKGVMPVTMCDGKKIGDGKPGPVSIKLRSLYQKKLDKIVNDK